MSRYMLAYKYSDIELLKLARFQHRIHAVLTQEKY